MAKSFDKRSRDLLASIRAIVAREERLDSLEWALSRDLHMVRRVVKNYRLSINSAMGEFIFSPAFNQIVDEGLDQFFSAIGNHVPRQTASLRKAQRNQMLRTLRKEYSRFIGSQVGMMAQNIIARISTMKVQKDLARVPAGISKAISKRIQTVRIDGVEFNRQQLKNVWDTLTQRYGNHEQVIFPSGQKRSLEAYVDGRTITTRAEINRSVQVITAGANGIFFGRINKTGTLDSCIFHEGELVFMSQAAKTQFITENPDAPVGHIRTVQELEAERSTHLFSFGCKHRVVVAATQFGSAERQAEQFAEKQLPIPDKVSESKVRQDIIQGRIAA